MHAGLVELPGHKSTDQELAASWTLLSSRGSTASKPRMLNRRKQVGIAISTYQRNACTGVPDHAQSQGICMLQQLRSERMMRGSIDLMSSSSFMRPRRVFLRDLRCSSSAFCGSSGAAGGLGGLGGPGAAGGLRESDGPGAAGGFRGFGGSGAGGKPSGKGLLVLGLSCMRACCCKSQHVFAYTEG